MNVSASTERCLEYIDARAADVMNAYTPGATPVFDDVGKPAGSTFLNFDPLSVALPDGAYLVVPCPDSRNCYTRDGALHLKGGQLLDSSGRAIAGLSDGRALGVLHIDPVDEALGRVREARIETDGSFVYDRTEIDPLTGTPHKERIVVGRIALARFPSATKLSALDAIHAQAPPDVLPHLGVPGDGNFGNLKPMQRETSGIDFERSLEKLHEAYVAFDAVAAAHKAQGTLGKTVMDLLK